MGRGSEALGSKKVIEGQTDEWTNRAGLFLERAREPDALYFAPGHTKFAGREPGLLSQFFAGYFLLEPICFRRPHDGEQFSKNWMKKKRCHTAEIFEVVCSLLALSKF